MKAVTEFASFALNKALAAKTALVAAGKTPEEIQTNLGETFKFEGEKLAYFVHAVELASANQTNLKRILVLKLNEGEAAPAKATELDGFHYVPEFLNLSAPKVEAKTDGKFSGRPKKGGGGPKSSPWGLSPEEKAAKNKKPAAVAK